MPIKTYRLRTLTAAVAVALGAALACAGAQAATITVTTTDDGSVAGECTLRDAIASANTNTVVAGCVAGEAGHDDIVFASGVTGTIALTEGELEIVEEASITGPGAALLTVDAQQNSRIFSMTGDASLTTVLTGLTIANGRTTADDDSGGAIRCLTALDLVDSVVTGSSTAGQNAPGGGLFTATTTVLTRSTVTGNWTEAYGSIAGGVMVVFGLGTLVDSTISDNWTEGGTAGGGGLVVLWAWFDATLINSTISGNATYGDNSQAGGFAAGGNAILINSTVSGNSTHGNNNPEGFTDAGAFSVSGNVTLLNSTIVDNLSASGGPSINLATPDTTLLTATNSMMANSAVDAPPLCSRPIDAASSTHNLATDSSCGSDTLVGGAPVAFEDLALGALADNGGPTRTHALLSGSFAIDAGDADACAATPVSNLDQRGGVRPVDGDADGTAICDVGSFEAADTDTIFTDGFETAGG
jgi:CSLREA domain-containing protein